jgi:Zn-dependent protease
MLNEQASSSMDQPVWRPSDYQDTVASPYEDLREKVSEVMQITGEYLAEEMEDDIRLVAPDQRHLITYEGQMLKNSETAYDDLDDLLRPEDKFALFRTSDSAAAPHKIHILDGRVVPVQGRPWLNLALFLATLLSVFFVGAPQGIQYALENNPDLDVADMYYIVIDGETGTLPRIGQLWRGAPYALSILLILGAHELGHYFAARRHKHAVSLPYFIPMPLTFLGTMGAVIRSREPMRNRKVLMDIGAAGPLAGLVFAIPILIYGLATSEVVTRVEQAPGTYLQEGNSIVYVVAKFVALGEFYPTATADVFINQMAFAGWLGLLVTALNLIPVGQLDGGHVLYSLFGERARLSFYPVLAVLIGLSVLTPQTIWVVWAILLFFLGRLYAPPLDDITPIGGARRGLAIFTLVIFVLVFVPRPIAIVSNNGGTPQDEPAEPELQPINFVIE